MNGIKHRPEDLTLKLQGANRRRLHFASDAVSQGKLQGFVGVAAGLRDTALEIFQAARLDPWIELLEGFQSLGHQVRGEQLGQGGSDGDRPRLSAGEIDVSVNGEPDTR